MMHAGRTTATKVARRLTGALRWCVSASGRRWVLKLTAGISTLPVVVVALLAALTPLPSQLRADQGAQTSIRVLDRSGHVMAEVRADDGARARWLTIEEVPPELRLALLAAEDQRFYWHPGVDVFAIARAAAQNIINRRIVSGASTLTQQLARTVVPRQRTMVGKLKEASVAVRIEASLSKDEILESYLNLVTFGPSLRGVEAASRFYYDKPASAVSLAEAATLAAMPRGPTLYDPRRSPDALRARRDLIVGRMLGRGWITDDQAERAKREPITVHGRATGWGAPHLVQGLLSGRVHPTLGPLQGRASELHTTLDGALQREVQTAARSLVRTMGDRHVTAASVVVLDNASGEVLAWVGAHDFFDEQGQGQNDGVLALRQPGSALKPFVYSAAIDDLGWNAATVLPDIELHLTSSRGTYRPRNYDGRYHGPVRLREALANSYNVPAVYAATAVGPARVLERLRAVGMTSLVQDAEHYGAAIALGDGEVRLIELANAYATLARGGVHKPVRTLRHARDTRGETIAIADEATGRVMKDTTAHILVDILADPHARLASFGPASVLELPFPVGAKTGTSKGYRDNLTVGISSEVTVAVWVGNFDGSPMQGVSGITGAGPLFRTVMMAAGRKRQAESLEAPRDLYEQVEICALSGKRPGPGCNHRVREVFEKGAAPQGACDMHVSREVDKRNGRLAGAGCGREAVAQRTFEVFEPRYGAWARTAGRNVAPDEWSPLCPGDDTAHRARRLRLRYPYDGAVFVLDPSLSEGAQGIVLRAEAPASVRRLQFEVDGAVVAAVGAPFEAIVRLSPGKHEVRARAEGRLVSELIEFEVKR